MTKLNTLPSEAWVTAFALSVCMTLVRDAFFWAWVILFFTNMLDWVAGRWAARKAGDFTRKRSREGLYSKAIGLSIAAVLRSVEAIVPYVVGDIYTRHLPTEGLISLAVTLLLIYEDLESLDRHRQALGARPVPLLSTILKKLRKITSGEEK